LHPPTRGTLDPVATQGGGDPPAVLLHGWAWSAAAPVAGMQPLTVSVEVDGKLVMTTVANVSRPDLVAVDVAPDPNHGFVADLPVEICREMLTGNHSIRATVQADGESTPHELASSPRCVCDFKSCPCS
jgi:hypothetical protein